MGTTDHLAELRAIGYEPDDLAPLLELEDQAHADAESYCSVEGFDHEAAEARTVAQVTELFGGTLPAGFFVNDDPRGYALKLAEGTGSISFRDWGGYEILAPELEDDDEDAEILERAHDLALNEGQIWDNVPASIRETWISEARAELEDDDEPDVPAAFSLRIEWGNAAMSTQDDLAGALSGVAAEIAGGAVDGNVRDENGNTVGTFGFGE